MRIIIFLGREERGALEVEGWVRAEDVTDFGDQGAQAGGVAEEEVVVAADDGEGGRLLFLEEGELCGEERHGGLLLFSVIGFENQLCEVESCGVFHHGIARQRRNNITSRGLYRGTMKMDRQTM